jgi:hypothetical protein
MEKENKKKYVTFRGWWLVMLFASVLLVVYFGWIISGHHLLHAKSHTAQAIGYYSLKVKEEMGLLRLDDVTTSLDAIFPYTHDDRGRKYNFSVVMVAERFIEESDPETKGKFSAYLQSRLINMNDSYAWGLYLFWGDMIPKRVYLDGLGSSYLGYRMLSKAYVLEHYKEYNKCDLTHKANELFDMSLEPIDIPMIKDVLYLAYIADLDQFFTENVATLEKLSELPESSPSGPTLAKFLTYIMKKRQEPGGRVEGKN